MYEIIKLASTQQKMQRILQIMTGLKFRQLSIIELEKIYLTLVKLLEPTNYHSDLFKDISKTIFIINHYFNIENPNMLLLEGLHLCKLNALNNQDYLKNINTCIDIVGNFEINTELIQTTTNVVLLADFYLKTMNETDYSEDLFWQFIKTTIDTTSFSNSSFFLSISVCLDENTNDSMYNLFHRTTLLLNQSHIFLNYAEFIKWFAL